MVAWGLLGMPTLLLGDVTLGADDEAERGGRDDDDLPAEDDGVAGRDVASAASRGRTGASLPADAVRRLLSADDSPE